MSSALTSRASNVDEVIARIAARGDAVVLVRTAGETSAAELVERMHNWRTSLADAGIGAGAVCSFHGDYGPETVSLMLALMSCGAVQVPFSAGAAMERSDLERTANVQWRIDPQTAAIERVGPAEISPHLLVDNLISLGHPGLIVFTSGSTGRPKAILHDVDRVAAKFKTARRPWRMLLMLLIDHFGGFNTLLACLADGGVGICVENRSPGDVCRAIAMLRGELLPTTPTFLGVLIASELWRQYDLTSLKLITYGAEPMPPATLKRIRELLPSVELKQTYGLSELGVLRSASPEQGSLWLKVGGDGFETRVVDGQLHIRSASSMLGYLNAPSPIDADGWMNTGDLVEERDGLMRFLGRKSEVINVGGQKVFPSEVEAIILEADGVTEVVVGTTEHPLLGNAVLAKVALAGTEDPKLAADRLRSFCRSRLQKYKVPMRFEFVDASTLMTERAKKRRV